jgi:hypothetical protein
VADASSGGQGQGIASRLIAVQKENLPQ